MKNHIEDDLQMSCVRWFKYQYPDIVIFAIPNGGKRNAIEAAKMKRTGTLAGVADLFIMQAKEILHPNYLHGLWIEIKVEKNNQTEAQKAFEVNATEAGYKYVICRSIDQFMTVVNNYLNP